MKCKKMEKNTKWRSKFIDNEKLLLAVTRLLTNVQREAV